MRPRLSIALLGCVTLLIAACGKKTPEGGGNGGGGGEQPADSTEYTVKPWAMRPDVPVRKVLKTDHRSTAREPGATDPAKPTTFTMTFDSERVETVLAANPADKKWTILRVENVRISSTNNDAPAAADRFAGRTIFVEKDGDRFRFSTAKGAEKLTPDEISQLERQYAPPKFAFASEWLLPDKPVRIGQTWSVDAPKVAAGLGMTGDIALDAEKSSLQGKLLRVYKKKDRQFGVMEVKGALVLKGSGATVVNPGSKADLEFQIDCCLDGGVYDLHIKWTSKYVAEGKDAKGEFKREIVRTVERRESEEVEAAEEKAEAAPAAADTTQYAVKPWAPRLNVPVRRTVTNAVRFEGWEPDAKGGKRFIDDREGAESVVVETVLAADPADKNWTKLRVEHVKGVSFFNGTAAPRRFAGRTFFVEKQAGRSRVTAAPNSKLSDEEITDLERRYDSPTPEFPVRWLLPDKPVRINESYSVDAAKIVNAYGPATQQFPTDAKAATGQGKLLRVYQKDGKQFGVLEVTFTLPFRSIGETKVAEGSKFEMRVTIDCCIDGSVNEAKVVAKVRGGGELTDPKGHTRIKLSGSHEVVETELAPK
jgi:hypothetical protein